MEDEIARQLKRLNDNVCAGAIAIVAAIVAAALLITLM